MWYHEVIGKEKCPIVDTWWQTETGAIMISPLPGATPTVPGTATRPLPGIIVDIVTKAGEPVGANEGGYLVIKHPWPSMLRTLWGDDERYKQAYWSEIPGMYFAGDGARRDERGYYWIMGRVDDVINVSGHRLGTAEVESALVSHEAVAEAAVVGRPDELKGQAIAAFVTLEGAHERQRRAERRAARARRERDRRAGQARRYPLYRRAAENALRQDHAAAAEGARVQRQSRGRCDHARRFFGAGEIEGR